MIMPEMPMERVSMAFAKFSNWKLNIFAGSVVQGLTNNPAYPNPPVSMADLKAASDGFGQAISDGWDGGRVLTAIKRAKRAAVISILRDEAHYVQIIAKHNPVVLLSSGFTAISKNTAQTPLIRPRILTTNNQHSAQLWLRLTRVPNANLYQVRWRVGAGEWVDGGIHPKARRLVLENLTPGTVYEIQVRALGGSTRYGEWSLSATKMAT